MRKEILLMFFCFAVLSSVSFVCAAANSSHIGFAITNRNYSGSVILNATFIIENQGTNATGDLQETANITFSNATAKARVQFIAFSSNGTRTTLGTTNSCAYGRNITEITCLGTITINASLDGLWTIMANITNSSTVSEGVNGSGYTYTGLNATQNATGVLFDSTPPQVTFLVSSAGTNLAGVNYSGVLVNINISINDSKSGTYAWTNNRNDSSGIIHGAVIMNITGPGTTQNITYTMNNVTNTNGTAFMFNYSINTSHLGSSGTYTVTIWANDSLNNLNKSEAFSFTLDILNPSITGVKAANTTQTVLYATISVNDVLSGLNGLCTTDRAGDTVAGTGLTGSGIKTLYLAETGLNCGTTYSYAFTCTSYAGNAKTTTLSFATANCQGSVAGGGGSGGTATTWTNTIVLSTTELSSEGVTKELSQQSRVEIKVGGKKHYVGVTSLTATSATIEISSDPVSVKLNIGQDAKLDLDKDGVYDMYVKLNNIANNKADISVTKIEEIVPVGEGAVSTSGEQVSSTGVGEQPTPTSEGKKSGNAWMWIIAIVLIAIIVGAGVAMKKKK